MNANTKYMYVLSPSFLWASYMQTGQLPHSSANMLISPQNFSVFIIFADMHYMQTERCPVAMCIYPLHRSQLRAASASLMYVANKVLRCTTQLQLLSVRSWEVEVRLHTALLKPTPAWGCVKATHRFITIYHVTNCNIDVTLIHYWCIILLYIISLRGGFGTLKKKQKTKKPQMHPDQSKLQQILMNHSLTKC